MRGLNRENSRHILYFSTYSHRESFRINRMELRICIPCLIKMDARHAVFQGIDDFAGIVAETVIRAVGHHRVGGLLRHRVSGDRTGFDQFLDMLFGHPPGRNGADQAVAVSGRLHIDRTRPAKSQPVIQGLVAVSVDHGNLIGANRSLRYNPVGAGRTGDGIEGPIRPEGFRGDLLGFLHRTGVDQIVTHFRRRHADIGAEHIFTEEVEELHADGMLQIGHPAHMPRTIPIVIAVLGKILQGFEVRRQQMFVVLKNGGINPIGGKLGSFGKKVNIFLDLTDQIERQPRNQVLPGQCENRQSLRHGANRLDQLDRLLFHTAVFCVQIDADCAVFGTFAQKRESVFQ